MSKTKRLLLALALSLALAACQSQAPTNPVNDGRVSLALTFAQWQEYSGEEGQTLARVRAPAAISRLDIFVLFDQDTLARTVAQITPGSNEFAAVLQVPIGEERRIVVEAWDDQGGVAPPVRAFRGVQAHVEVQPNVAREVAVTLYPVPLAGQSVVLIVGSAQGAPGTSGHLVPITLISADSLSGIQFDLNYDARLISPVAALRTRPLAFDTLATNVISSQQGQALRMLMFAVSGERLPALFDPTEIIKVDFSVDIEAEAGTQTPLTLSNFTVLDQNRKRLGVLAVEGGSFEIAGGQ
ncbi:hypothetical protein HUU05_01185 [candidate division KSB1 bacterium]|nr:hypothetical protein [candidate division KSB1 bacterium]